MPTMKYFVITSDCIQGAKTVVSAYIAALLDRNNIKINYLKLSPALSTKLGLLSPEAVGEAFVTYDGGQVDFDVGIIERSISYTLSAKSCLTLGQAIDSVILKEQSSKECCFDFLSMDQHLVNYILDYIDQFPKDRITVIEVGGSIHDLGTLAFVKAIAKLNESVDINMIHIGSDTQYFEKEFPTHWQTGKALFIDKEKNMFGSQHSFSNKVKEKIKQQLEQYLDIQLAPIDMETTYLHSPFK